MKLSNCTRTTHPIEERSANIREDKGKTEGHGKKKPKHISERMLVNK